MKNLVILVAVSAISFHLLAQGKAIGSFTGLPLYQGKKAGPVMNYSDVKGHYFYDEDFRAAKGVTKEGEVISIPQAKLNLFSNEVWYAQDQTEYTASADQFQRLIFLGDPETHTSDVVFETQKVNGVDGFVQVMNSGDIKLLKRRITELRRGEYDAMLGKFDYRFMQRNQFFIERGKAVVRIKKLNEKNLTAFVSFSPSVKEWLEVNKNKLETETEVATFLEYYNATHANL